MAMLPNCARCRRFFEDFAVGIDCKKAPAYCREFRVKLAEDQKLIAVS